MLFSVRVRASVREWLRALHGYEPNDKKNEDIPRVFAQPPEIEDLRVDFLDLVGQSVEEELQRLGQLGVAAAHPARVKRLCAQPVSLSLRAKIKRRRDKETTFIRKEERE